MYDQFYGFREPPFNITPDPRFLFFSDRHREAYNHILFGIRERKGFIQITGEVGAGKTTLCRALLEELGPNYVTALILNPCLSPTQLLRTRCRFYQRSLLWPRVTLAYCSIIFAARRAAWSSPAPKMER